MSAKNISNVLAKKFDIIDIDFVVKEAKQGLLMIVPYLKSRSVMNRLDEAFGVFGWESKLNAIYENNRLTGYECTITASELNISKTDAGVASAIDSIKGAASDALKRAAVQFGVGRYLYEIKEIWVRDQGNGNFNINEVVSQWPDSALSEKDLESRLAGGKKTIFLEQANQKSIRENKKVIFHNV